MLSNKYYYIIYEILNNKICNKYIIYKYISYIYLYAGSYSVLLIRNLDQRKTNWVIQNYETNKSPEAWDQNPGLKNFCLKFCPLYHNLISIFSSENTLWTQYQNSDLYAIDVYNFQQMTIIQVVTNAGVFSSHPWGSFNLPIISIKH